ncbi:MAG: hypothetical protein ACI8QC_002005 [Planctomycetota bacterium]
MKALSTRAGAVLGAALALGFHLLAWGGLGGFVARMDFNQALFEDFMGPYLGQGQAFLAGADQPVAGFLYSPFFGQLMEPLAMLGPQAASWVWLAVLVLACAVLLALGPVLLGAQQRRELGPLGAGLLSFLGLTSVPILHGLYWGQVSAPLMALTLLGCVLAARGRSVLGGALVGLAGALKFYPLAFGLLLVARRDRRAVGTMGLTFVVAAGVLPMLELGARGTVTFYGALGDALLQARAGAWVDADASQYGAAWLARLWQSAPALLLHGLSRILAVVLCVRIVRDLWQGPAERELHARTAAFACVLPLWLEPAWPHYLAYLPFAMVLAYSRGPLGRASALLSGLLSGAVLFRLLDDHARFGASGVMLIASLVLLPALLRPDAS